MLNLVPWPGIEPRPPAPRILTTGSSERSWQRSFQTKRPRLWAARWKAWVGMGVLLWHQQKEVYGWGPRPNSQGRWRGRAGSQADFQVPELELTSSFLLYSSLFFLVLLPLPWPSILLPYPSFLSFPLPLTPAPCPLIVPAFSLALFLLPSSQFKFNPPLGRLWTLFLSYVSNFLEHNQFTLHENEPCHVLIHFSWVRLFAPCGL